MSNVAENKLDILKEKLEQIPYFQKALSQKYISIDENYNYITYNTASKAKRRLNVTEELVQLESFLKLIFEYNYNINRIDVYKSVKMGSDSKEADIVIYNNNEHIKPLIVVECKREDINEKQFQIAIEQAYSYAHVLTARYIWVTSSIKNSYFEVVKDFPVLRKAIPDLPKNNEEVPQYKYEKGNKSKSPQPISQEKLRQIFSSVHQALWGGGALAPSMAFDELDKLIFCKIWDERWKINNPSSKGEPYDFQIITYPDDKGDIIAKQKLAERVKKLYEQGRRKDPEVFKEDIRLNQDKIYTVVEYLQDINISETDLDAKGLAFEEFMGSFFRGDFGQFFTPRPIVDFIVKSLNITKDSKVLDTSCGSGGFLLAALKKVRDKADELYPEKDVPDDRLAWFSYWHSFAENNLFGIEINEQISRVAKMNMIIHDDGHTNVVTNDALKLPETIRKENRNLKFEDNTFDFIITNPPFGANVRESENNFFKKYELAKKNIGIVNLKTKLEYRINQKTEVMFFERCWNYLKENGFLALVIPDGILTNSSLQYVRDYIFEKFRIIAVVSLPQHTFMQAEAGVKSSVLFLQKRPIKISNKMAESLEKIKAKYIDYDDKDYSEDLVQDYKKEIFKIIPDVPVLMIEVENIGYDATGRKIEGSELSEVSKNIQDFIKEQGL